MPFILLLFIVWLAMQGKIATYVAFASQPVNTAAAAQAGNAVGKMFGNILGTTPPN